jgi:hypothetical protein
VVPVPGDPAGEPRSQPVRLGGRLRRRLDGDRAGQRRDRFFTYLTSIREENAFFEAGATAGFGVRLVTEGPERRSLVAEAFEGAPALAAGIDRGTEILAIGQTPGALRPVADIIAAEGAFGVTNALGPNTAGTTRTLRVRDTAGAVREVTLAKTDFALPPVSPRYGALILQDGGRQVGYLNLRTFISTADPALREAFARFRSQGVTEVIIDLRYNGGGLISTAELMNDLLGRDRTSGEVASLTVYRPEKSSQNRTRFFRPQAESIAPTRVAFIGTAGTGVRERAGDQQHAALPGRPHGADRRQHLRQARGPDRARPQRVRRSSAHHRPGDSEQRGPGRLFQRPGREGGGELPGHGRPGAAAGRPG